MLIQRVEIKKGGSNLLKRSNLGLFKRHTIFPTRTNLAPDAILYFQKKFTLIQESDPCSVYSSMGQSPTCIILSYQKSISPVQPFNTRNMLRLFSFIYYYIFDI